MPPPSKRVSRFHAGLFSYRTICSSNVHKEGLQEPLDIGGSVMKLSAPIFHLKRQAKQLSRAQKIPLNKALDQIAHLEGFSCWSLLSAQVTLERPSSELFAKLNPGDLVLLGARPGHGKTIMGLELIAESLKADRSGVFFTLEFNGKEALERFEAISRNVKTRDRSVQIDTSESISADYVIARLATASRGTIAVIDYLQIMDQDRTKPALSKQVSALKAFATEIGIIIVFISQIDRAYELSAKPLPELDDVRLPNPLDLNLFDKSCFLNNGKTRIDILN